MSVGQLGNLQLEKLVHGRPVPCALIDSIRAKQSLSRNARTISPWNHQPSVPFIFRLYRGLPGILLFYATDAIGIHDKITYVVQLHTWYVPSVHSQMPLAQGATCARTWAAPARSKMVAVSKLKLEDRNMVKGLWASRAFWVSSRDMDTFNINQRVKSRKQPDDSGSRMVDIKMSINRKGKLLGA